LKCSSDIFTYKPDNDLGVFKMRKSLIATLILSLALGLQVTSSSANAPERADYIVKFVDQVNLDQEIAALEKGNVGASRVFRNAFKGGVFSMTDAQAIALSRNPRIEIIEKDQEISISTSQTSNLPWGLDRIDAGNVTPKIQGSYDYGSEGNQVTAYVIDTGILTSHTQFEGRARFGVNTTGDQINQDCNGHGTHVAGTIGGKDFGVAKRVSLVAVKVLNCAGSGTWSGVIAGMDWVVGVNDGTTKAVANLSLGGGFSSSVNAAAERLVADNVVVAVAAGNDGRDAKNYSPASARNVITVGATDRTDTRASFSNFGSTVELFAPGVSVLSAVNTNDSATASYSGTSMASPHVAGAAARLLSSAACTAPCNAASVRSQLLNQTTKGVVVRAGNGSPNALLYMGPTQ
jgi:subtilisin family serine protease